MIVVDLNARCWELGDLSSGARNFRTRSLVVRSVRWDKKQNIIDMLSSNTDNLGVDKVRKVLKCLYLC